MTVRRRNSRRFKPIPDKCEVILFGSASKHILPNYDKFIWVSQEIPDRNKRSRNRRITETYRWYNFQNDPCKSTKVVIKHYINFGQYPTKKFRNLFESAEAQKIKALYFYDGDIRGDGFNHMKSYMKVVR